MIDRKTYQKIDCYIAKDELTGMFAHGETLKDAAEDLQNKVFESMSVTDRIQMFCKEFEKGIAYKGSIFFDWHNKLTGSCLMGRNQFVKEKGMSLEDEYTVDEFIKLCENNYGSDVIAELKREWERLND